MRLFDQPCEAYSGRDPDLMAAAMHTQRIDRLQKELEGLEGEFREKLIRALKSCAAGYWGLLGQNDHINRPGLVEKWTRESGAAELLELGRAIDALRGRIGLHDPFPLYAHFLALRGRKGANHPGEPKLAQAWLDELNDPTDRKTR